MDVTREIPFIKELRKKGDELITSCKALEQGKERDLAIVKFQEGVMWLGMVLKRIHDLNPGVCKDPYPSSKDPSTGTTIEPTADNLKF